MTVVIGGESIPVLLLKTKSTPHDGYEEYFSSPDNGQYAPFFVPVLEHRFSETALEEVKSFIAEGGLYSSSKSLGDVKYGGIIFTSQRAVEAFSQVVHDIRKSTGSEDIGLTAELPLYVVGPATARGLRALNLPCPVVGEESGNGEALAHLILDHYNDLILQRQKQQDQTQKLPLLFLVGEQRRDIIPKTLASGSSYSQRAIGVDELVVYETAEMQSFRSQFSALHSSNAQQGTAIQWVVVFSPTGCRAMLESLGLVDPQSHTVMEDALQAKHTFIATIGPTTRDYLKREFGFEPHVCSPKPSPDGIGGAITEFMSNLSKPDA